MNARITTRNGGTAAVTTSATGTDFVPLPAHPATVVTLFNYTGTPIEWRIRAGTAIRLNDQLGQSITGINNSSDISIRRLDVDNTPVTLPFHFQD